MLKPVAQVGTISPKVAEPDLEPPKTAETLIITSDDEPWESTHELEGSLAPVTPAPKHTAKRLNPIKLKQMEDRVAALEAELSDLDARITRPNSSRPSSPPPSPPALSQPSSKPCANSKPPAPPSGKTSPHNSKSKPRPRHPSSSPRESLFLLSTTYAHPCCRRRRNRRILRWPSRSNRPGRHLPRSPAPLEQLRNGLKIISPHGDATIVAKLLTADQLRAKPQSFDLIILAVKSYALEQPLKTSRPLSAQAQQSCRFSTACASSIFSTHASVPSMSSAALAASTAMSTPTAVSFNFPSSATSPSANATENKHHA